MPNTIELRCKFVRGFENLVEPVSGMAGDSTATFISQKISKIRWKPDPNQIVEKPELFVTGSWDNGVGKMPKSWLHKVYM